MYFATPRGGGEAVNVFDFGGYAVSTFNCVKSYKVGSCVGFINAHDAPDG